MDWAESERTAGLVFPADYREFVETYDGGEIDAYLSVSTPPAPGSPCGDLLDGVDSAPGYLEESGTLLSAGTLPPSLPFAHLGHGDVAFSLCEDTPGDWRVAVLQRQVAYGASPWVVFDGGMASFCVAVLTGEASPLGARLSEEDRHEFVGRR
ncbi:SMI1/KNR4 family protein [Streptomyces incanus]|uniref:SMI1/KNR4 family protein n=1 Tax=Streptomyces incanus TaxID=887453 RepID=A0ABW0XP42_9ACTN